MNARCFASLRPSVLVAGFGLLFAGPLPAQLFTNLYNFTGSDGATPYCTLIVSGNFLYGTTKDGGLGSGTVFRMNTDGSGFTNLHKFEPTSGPLATNNDGANPYARLLLVDSTLYGTAPYGGPNSRGTIFKLNTDGGGFTVLHSFPSPDHGEPYDGLILSGDMLYGTSGEGGLYNWGSVFAIKTNGTGFTNLFSFNLNGSDGFYPYAGGGLVLSGNTLYGAAQYGGTANINAGVIFKVSTNGTGYTNVYNFALGTDGGNPNNGMVLVGNTLYGATQFGGSDGKGAVFKVNTDGSGFTNLHSFTGGFNEAYSYAGLCLSGNTLYGTTYLGGVGNKGTVFRMNLDGSGFTNVHHFAGTPDGANLYGGVVMAGNILYGTASAGGISNFGTLFSITFPLPAPPSLSILRSGTNVVLLWPTNTGVFTLQFATNLAFPITWSNAAPAPGIVNGQNAVTNPALGKQVFYRLSQ